MADQAPTRRTLIAGMAAGGLALAATTATANAADHTSKGGSEGSEAHLAHSSKAYHPDAAKIKDRKEDSVTFEWDDLKSGTCTLKGLKLIIDSNGRASFTGSVSTSSPNAFGDVFDLKFQFRDVNNNTLHVSPLFNSPRMKVKNHQYAYTGNFTFLQIHFPFVVAVLAGYDC